MTLNRRELRVLKKIFLCALIIPFSVNSVVETFARASIEIFLENRLT